MKMIPIMLFALIAVSFAFAVYAAETQMQYKQSTLPDGSNVMEYNGGDGTVMKQTQKKDGTIITEATDASGNQTISTQRPDGTVSVKTKTKD